MPTLSGDFWGEAFYIWQDREVRVGIRPQYLALRKGEFLIDTLSSVEDTKGSTGERGQLTLTNLRLFWQSHSSAKSTISVGLGCVQGLAVKSATSRLRGGVTQALCVTAKSMAGGAGVAPPGGRYEFIFTSLVKASPRLFGTAQGVLRAHETSKLYRDLKMRGAVIKDKSLILLPGERIFSRMEGVWNLSADQGNLGILITTSLRMVWHAQLAENFNVSVPYSQMATLELRDSRFGRALVVECRPGAGGYLLGFKIDDAASRDRALTELLTLHAAWYERPDFGIRYDVETDAAAAGDGAAGGANAAAPKARIMDDVQIVEDGGAEEEGKGGEGGGGRGGGGAGGDALAAYFAEGAEELEVDRPIVFSQLLGLAVEAPPAGLTLERLWAVT